MKKRSGKLARWLAGKAKKNMRALCYQPRIEALEERMLLSTDTWTGGGGVNTNWSNPANWDNGAPGPNDDLNFPGTAPNL